MKTSYDKSTDSLYVGLRPMPSVRTIEIEDDVMLDRGADGAPIGYDIQHASTKADPIGRIVLGENLAAAE